MLQVEITMVTALLLSGVVLITEIAIAIAIISTLFFVETNWYYFYNYFFLVFGSIFYFFSKNKSSAWGSIRQKEDSKISKLITEGLNGINEVFLLGKERFFHSRLVQYNKTKAEN